MPLFLRLSFVLFDGLVSVLFLTAGILRQRLQRNAALTWVGACRRIPRFVSWLRESHQPPIWIKWTHCQPVPLWQPGCPRSISGPSCVQLVGRSVAPARQVQTQVARYPDNSSFTHNKRWQATTIPSGLVAHCPTPSPGFVAAAIATTP